MSNSPKPHNQYCNDSIIHKIDRFIQFFIGFANLEGTTVYQHHDRLRVKGFELKQDLQYLIGQNSPYLDTHLQTNNPQNLLLLLVSWD